MASIIKPKYSNTASAVPTTVDLADGEFCINTADRIIYQRVGGSVIAVANYSTGGGGGSLPSVTDDGTNVVVNPTTSVRIRTQATAQAQVYVEDTFAVVGDVAALGNGTSVTVDDGTEDVLVNAAALTINAPVVVPNQASGTPVSGSPRFYSQQLAGFDFLSAAKVSGEAWPLAPHPFFRQYALWMPGGSTTISTERCTVTAVGTVSTPNPSSTNRLSQTRRFVITSAAAAGSLASARPGALEMWRGNTAGFGGFFVAVRLALVTLQAGMRAFAGIISTATSAPTNVDPTTTTAGAKIGLAINDNTGNWKLVHNDGSAAMTVIDLGAGFPVNNSDVIEMFLYCGPNGSSVQYLVRNLNSASTASGTLSTNLPSNTTIMGRQIWATNNAATSAVAFACMMFGFESLN